MHEGRKLYQEIQKTVPETTSILENYVLISANGEFYKCYLHPTAVEYYDQFYGEEENIYRKDSEPFPDPLVDHIYGIETETGKNLLLDRYGTVFCTIEEARQAKERIHPEYQQDIEIFSLKDFSDRGWYDENEIFFHRARWSYLWYKYQVTKTILMDSTISYGLFLPNNIFHALWERKVRKSLPIKSVEHFSRDVFGYRVNNTIYLDFEEIEKIELKKLVKLIPYGFSNIGKPPLIFDSVEEALKFENIPEYFNLDKYKEEYAERIELDREYDQHPILGRITLTKEDPTLKTNKLTVFPHTLILFRFLGFPAEKMIIPSDLEKKMLTPCHRINI